MIKEIEDLKNELLVHKRQKEMIGKLKIDLIQSKERVLSLEQRLQSECDSKVASYFEQLENLKKQYEEKVTKYRMNYASHVFKIQSCILYVGKHLG